MFGWVAIDEVPITHDLGHGDNRRSSVGPSLARQPNYFFVGRVVWANMPGFRLLCWNVDRANQMASVT